MIKIKNCNNIDEWEITINKNYLNLKYAIKSMLLIELVKVQLQKL